MTLATACGAGSQQPLRQLPVQLGHAAPPTPSPQPTATPLPPPSCTQPAAEILKWSQGKGPSPDTLLMSGQVKSNCQVAVDVTVALRWLDGPERMDSPRAFAILRRVQPGELRPFSEIVVGRGSSRAELTADVASSVVGRRR